MSGHFERAFQTLRNVAIQGYDTERRVFYWNDASADLYGYTAREAAGRRLEDLIIPAEMVDGAVQEINAWVAGGPPPSGGELDLRHKDGRRVRVRSNHLSLRDESGTPSLFCLDVPLEEQVTLEATLNALWPADARLNLSGPGVRADRDILASLSHAVRTPMNAVSGFTERLAHSLTSDPDRGRAPESSLTRSDPTGPCDVARIVTQNLALLGAVPMALDPHSIKVQVQDVLIEVASLLMVTQPERDDLLSINPAPTDLRAVTDPFLLTHALAALARFGLENGFGRDRLVLSAHQRQAVGNIVTFEVAHVGPPLPDDVRLRLVSAQPLVTRRPPAGNLSALFHLSIVQRIALATGAFLGFERTPSGVNRAILGVKASPDPG